MSEQYDAWPWVTQDWSSANTHSYVKLASDTRIEQFEARMVEFAKTLPIPSDDGKINPLYTFSFLNAGDIHLYSKALRAYKLGGDITTVNTFALIAVLILIMASINFTNLTSAQAIKRTREVRYPQNTWCKPQANHAAIFIRECPDQPVGACYQHDNG